MPSPTTELGQEAQLSLQVAVECDRCQGPMTRVGWVPQPDGEGGLRRVTVFRCEACGRLYDALWNYRDGTGSL